MDEPGSMDQSRRQEDCNFIGIAYGLFIDLYNFFYASTSIRDGAYICSGEERCQVLRGIDA